jgi:hypothetical protein
MAVVVICIAARIRIEYARGKLSIGTGPLGGVRRHTRLDVTACYTYRYVCRYT